jgi:predicted nucleic acid-binding protein
MVVVADTSPLNYLIQIEQQELLRRFFGQVLIPGAVLAELQRESAPGPVRQWVANLPEWIIVESVAATDTSLLRELGRGEREAILLAETYQAALLVIDERKGTMIARARGLETVGTLGILARAHKRGWVDSKELFDRLIRTTSFRYSDELRMVFLASLDN